jgi:leucyl/phenylalanyl-tRNA---protein transferase
MFSLERDASKIAMARLCDELVGRDYRMIDCQMATPHLMSLGAKLLPRAEFVARLATYTSTAVPSRRWTESLSPPPTHR